MLCTVMIYMCDHDLCTTATSDQVMAPFVNHYRPVVQSMLDTINDIESSKSPTDPLIRSSIYPFTHSSVHLSVHSLTS